jgi:type II secretory pathway pseudopilin PulG
MTESRLPSRLCAEHGYLMVALLVAMSVMAIMMGAALPAWNTLARREKEAELVFRGEQYARAIGLYQRRFANAPVPSIDTLVEQRFLRKKYKDPITNDDFQPLGPGGSLPGQTQQGLQLQAGGARGGATPAQAGRGGQVVGGIIGVTSKSQEKSLRLYNGQDAYNQWIFMPTVQAGRVGGDGGRAGGRGPEGRGGRGVDGRGGRGPDGRGGFDGRGGPDGRGRGLPQGNGGRGGGQPTPRGRLF